MSTMLRWTEEQLAAHKARVRSATKSAVKAAIPAPATPLQKLQALGRLKTGTLNKTEARYAGYLEAEKFAGRVLWWKFEALKLRLATNTFLTVDFAVMVASGVLEMRDVKGSAGVVMDDARAKLKVAADTYPLVFKIVMPRKGGGWDEEIVR
jgi:hypothetical protein